MCKLGVEHIPRPSHMLQCSHSAKGTYYYIVHIQPRVHSTHILPRVHVTVLTFSQGYTLLEFSIQPRVYIVTLLTSSKWYMLLHCSHSAKGTCYLAHNHPRLRIVRILHSAKSIHCYFTDIQQMVHVVTLLTFSQGYMLPCSQSPKAAHC